MLKIYILKTGHFERYADNILLSVLLFERIGVSQLM